MNDVDVSVIAVSWNTADCLPEALETTSQAMGVLTHEVVVVDNGSTDGSVGLLRDRPDVRLVELGTNTGFTHAANVGVANTSGTYLLFLNPDIVAGEGVVSALVDLLDGHPEAWGATPWFRHPDGSPQHFWHRLPRDPLVVACFTRFGRRIDRAAGFPMRRYRRYERLPDPPGLVTIEAAGAAFLLVRRADFLEAGGFDERFLNFGQDTDFARRMKRRGKVLLGAGDVSVRHRAGVTFHRLPRWERDGQLVLAVRQFLAGEPAWRRWPLELMIRFDLRLPGPDRRLRRARALERAVR